MLNSFGFLFLILLNRSIHVIRPKFGIALFYELQRFSFYTYCIFTAVKYGKTDHMHNLWHIFCYSVSDFFSSDISGLYFLTISQNCFSISSSSSGVSFASSIISPLFFKNPDVIEKHRGQGKYVLSKNSITSMKPNCNLPEPRIL